MKPTLLQTAAQLNKRTDYWQKVLHTAPANLLAYWPLWEGSGTVANDISGNARHGAYGGVALGFPGIGDGHYAPRFDGTGDYVNIYSAGLSSAFNYASYTIAGWVAVDPSYNWTTGSGVVVRLAYDPNNQAQVSLAAATLAGYHNGDEKVSDPQGAIQATGRWTHFAMTLSGTHYHTVYHLGQLLADTEDAIGEWDYENYPLSANYCAIGAADSSGTTGFTGQIAHVGIWSTALTALQVQYLARL